MILCQKDSYCVDGIGEVLVCETSANGFRSVLKDSIFYPEGGGQPSDHGWINGIPIHDVQKIDGQIWHFSNNSIALGICQQRLDWDRRYDHMQQHTGQHLLTAIIQDNLGFKTVGFHLGERVSTIDLDSSNMDKDQIHMIEQLVVNAIQQSSAVTAKSMSVEDFSGDPNIRTRGLPEGFQGAVRVIEIKGIDSNNCGGTHVSDISELQSVLILKCERMKGRIRLHFLFGNRLRKFVQQILLRQKQLTTIFNQGPEEHVGVAQKWQTERKETSRTIKKLQHELCEYLGQRLLQNQPTVLFRPDFDLNTLAKIANFAVQNDPSVRFALTGNSVFLIHSPLAHQNKEQILQIIDGRGGGKAPRLQGKCGAPEKVEQLSTLL